MMVELFAAGLAGLGMAFAHNQLMDKREKAHELKIKRVDHVHAQDNALLDGEDSDDTAEYSPRMSTCAVCQSRLPRDELWHVPVYDGPEHIDTVPVCPSAGELCELVESEVPAVQPIVSPAKSTPASQVKPGEIP